MYRYDDPFGATFYPPNGYRCRCSVTALSEHDIQSEGLTVQQSNAENLVDVDMVYNKKGDTYATKAFKTADGRLLVADRGFDYNVGRMNYRPDLDKYDRALAHQFGGMVGRNRKVRIPARPFLALTQKDEAKLMNDVQDYFQNLVR